MNKAKELSEALIELSNLTPVIQKHLNDYQESIGKLNSIIGKNPKAKKENSVVDSRSAIEKRIDSIEMAQILLKTEFKTIQSQLNTIQVRLNNQMLI